MLPVDLLPNLLASDDADLHKKIYSLVKESSKKDLMERFKGLGIEKKKEIDFIDSFFTGSGWGDIQVIDFSPEAKRAIVVLDNSPFASALRGKAKAAVDVLFRGMLAGAFSSIFEENIDCVEAECVALNNERCKFVVKPQMEFDFSNKMVQDQLTPE